MKKIEAFQIRKIYAVGNALGIVEAGNGSDELHALIGGMVGKDSIKDLSYMEASTVISRLEQLQGNHVPPKRKTSKKYDEVPGGITAGQQKKVWALMYELKKQDVDSNPAQLGDRLCGIIKKELHVECRAQNPFIWLDFETGNRLIEILKKYVSNAKRKREG